MPEQPKKPVYKFIEVKSGIAKKSGNPYNLITLANPDTFDQLLTSFDPMRTGPLDHFRRGDEVHVDFEAVKRFNDTTPVAYSVTKAPKVG